MSSPSLSRLFGRPLRIGTRGSPLALTQAHLVAAALAAAHPEAPPAEIVAIKTSGDRITDRPLAEVGGKGLFAKEIEAALHAGDVDCGVHSAKDMETVLPDGLIITAVLPREDPRDALVCPVARTIAELPQGARLGSASARRSALLRSLRPDLRVDLIRGNVGTRLAKVASGEYDATLLAMAGLIRTDSVGEAGPISTDEFLPAAGQGIVAVECRASDEDAIAHLAPINDAPAMEALEAERAVLAVLDGSCQTPIAAHAAREAGELRVRGLLANPDGPGLWRAERRSVDQSPVTLGAAVGAEIKAAAPPGILAA